MTSAAARPRDVLILGCGRSGTSIVGELFEVLPGFRYLSEPPLDELAAASGAPALATKVPHVSDDLDARARLEAMLHAMDDPIVLWVVRHPLDAVSSLRVGIADGWGHHPRPPDWQAWRERPLVERCAHHWATINSTHWEAARGQVARVIRFEELIADPEAMARDIATMSGTWVDERTTTWWRRVRDRDDEHFIEAQTSRRRSRRDHTVRVGRWRENLSDDDARRAWEIVAPAAALHHYSSPVAAPPGFRARRRPGV